MPTTTSDWSNSEAATITVTDWWFKNPSNPAHNITVKVHGWNPTETRPTAVYEPSGRDRQIVLRGPMLGDQSGLQVRTFSETEHDNLRTLLRSQDTMLLQNLFGQQWYLEINGNISRQERAAQPTPSETWPVRHFYEWSIPLIEVDVPDFNLPAGTTSDGLKYEAMSQAEYDALGTYDSNTLYFII